MLNSKENEHFLKQVEKSGLTKSVYLRKLIAGKIIHASKPEEYFEVRRLIANMANNINQIAKVANTCSEVDHGQVLVLQQMVQKCWQHIRDL